MHDSEQEHRGITGCHVTYESAMWEARAAWDTISVQLLLGHQIER